MGVGGCVCACACGGLTITQHTGGNDPPAKDTIDRYPSAKAFNVYFVLVDAVGRQTRQRRQLQLDPGSSSQGGLSGVDIREESASLADQNRPLVIVIQGVEGLNPIALRDFIMVLSEVGSKDFQGCF